MFNYKKALLGFTFLCVMLLVSNSTSAQSLDREVGIRFSGFNNFDFIYKKEFKENRWLRIRAVFANVQSSPSIDNSISNTRFAFGIGIGVEFRKSLTDKLELIHGPEPRLGSILKFSDFGNDFTLSGGLGYVAGIQYNFNSSISLGAEIIPSISVNYMNNESRNKSMNISAGFSLDSAALTLVYRFPKKEK